MEFITETYLSKKERLMNHCKIAAKNVAKNAIYMKTPSRKSEKRSINGREMCRRNNKFS